MAQQHDKDQKPESDRDRRRGGKDASEITETDLAPDKMGRNSMQGEDQDQVHNERQAVPDAKREADEDPIETMEKTDKDVRAKRDLGKRS